MRLITTIINWLFILIKVGECGYLTYTGALLRACVL